MKDLYTPRPREKFTYPENTPLLDQLQKRLEHESNRAAPKKTVDDVYPNGFVCEAWFISRIIGVLEEQQKEIAALNRRIEGRP